MFPSSSSSQELLLSYYNRRLLQHSPLYHPPPEFAASPPFSTAISQIDASPDRYKTPNNGFEANVIMVISVLLCGLFCSLCLNSIIRCALKCSDFVARNAAHGNSDGNYHGHDNNRTSSAALANTGGVRKKALKTFPTVSYSPDLKLPGLDTECVICLSEFAPAERIRLFPKCNHGFHVRCINRWLTSHSSCPTCRNCLVETCQKIGGCNQASSSEQPPPPPPPPPSVSLVQEIIVNVAPLEREDMIHSS